MCCYPEKGLWPHVPQSRALLSWTGLSKAAASGDLAGSARKPEPGIVARVAAPLVQGLYAALQASSGGQALTLPPPTVRLGHQHHPWDPATALHHLWLRGWVVVRASLSFSHVSCPLPPGTPRLALALPRTDLGDRPHAPQLLDLLWSCVHHPVCSCPSARGARGACVSILASGPHHEDKAGLWTWLTLSARWLGRGSSIHQP